MEWALIIEKVIGWAVPVLCTAICAYLATHKEKYDKGKEAVEQAEWDSRSKKVTDEIEDLRVHHDEDKTDIQHQIEDLKQVDKQIVDKLDLIMTKIEENHAEAVERSKSADVKTTTAFTEIYQRDLIVDGKGYIRNKTITPQQLANYEKRYKQYKEWGGNGDVEIWIKRIRELPVNYQMIICDDDRGV